MILRGTNQLLVGTDIGVFAITTTQPKGNKPPVTTVRPLGTGLPNVPISSLALEPEDPNLLIAATYGRGIYQYRFGPPMESPPPPPPPTPAPFQGEPVAGPFGFELDEEGWTATSRSATMFWRRGAPGHVSGTSFQVIPYTDESAATLTSPEMTLPQPDYSTVVVTWWQHLNIEEGFDFVSVQWSSDGDKWHAIEGAAFTGMNPEYPDFTQMSATFAAPPGSLFIRFQLASDQLVSSPPYEGVAIDDVTVQR